MLSIRCGYRSKEVINICCKTCIHLTTCYWNIYLSQKLYSLFCFVFLLYSLVILQDREKSTGANLSKIIRRLRIFKFCGKVKSPVVNIVPIVDSKFYNIKNKIIPNVRDKILKVATKQKLLENKLLMACSSIRQSCVHLSELVAVFGKLLMVY